VRPVRAFPPPLPPGAVGGRRSHGAESGEGDGLTTYAANKTARAHGAATFVDKVIKEARPADLPVEHGNGARADHRPGGCDEARGDGFAGSAVTLVP